MRDLHGDRQRTTPQSRDCKQGKVEQSQLSEHPHAAKRQFREISMKTICKKLIKLMIFCGLPAIPICAQIPYGLNFKTPFPFYVGNQYMPAGSYKVTEPFGAAVLLVQDVDRKYSTFIGYIPTETFAPVKQGEATFRKYGNTAFLASFTVSGETLGMDFLPDNRETQTALTQGEQASNDTVPLEAIRAGN
jgi:hypothetical protein